MAEHGIKYNIWTNESYYECDDDKYTDKCNVNVPAKFNWKIYLPVN